MNDSVKSERKGFLYWCAEPFRSERKLSPALLALFTLINGIVLTNALLHDPSVGYDARDHLLYIFTLSEFKLPSPEDTAQFFSPPLPYLPPALFAFILNPDYAWFGKFAQLMNVAYSCILCLYLLKICDAVSRGNQRLKLGSLGLLAMFPAYYKTFAFVRGEPLLACIATVAVYQALALFLKRDFSSRRITALGISLGLAVLCRQWGFFLFPALGIWVVFLWLKEKEQGPRMLKALALAVVISFLVGGWFYLRHHFRFGSVKAFNRGGASSFSLANQPREFYASLGLEKLFTDPVRESFTNQLVPKLYSEFWGDHECYFLVYGWNRVKRLYLSGWQLAAQLNEGADPSFFQTNRAEMARFLGRVNLLALLPTALLLLSFLYACRGFWKDGQAGQPGSPRGLLLPWLVLLCSAAGYFWFLIMYPNPKGDTIKATYLLHAFPCAAILGGAFLSEVREKVPRFAGILWFLLALVAIHNTPTFFTHYVPWR